MSSMFDSKVYQLRQNREYQTFNLYRFMAAMADNEYRVNDFGTTPDRSYDDFQGGAKLELVSRPSVNSRKWWTFTWVESNGRRYSVDSQDFELLTWRVCQRHADVQNDMLMKKHGETKELKGYFDNDSGHCSKCGKINYRNDRGDKWCSNINCPY